MEQSVSSALPVPGEVYNHPEHGAWRVVSQILEDGKVGLSGPLPMRSYMRVVADELIDPTKGWQREDSET